MPDEILSYDSAVDGMPITAYAWHARSPRGIVVIAHGAAEHALRYERFARALNDAGYHAYAPDHRGHGQTSGLEHLGDFGEGGWDALVADVVQLLDDARARHGGLPVVLFGHSMGSLVVQQLAPDVSRSIAALILCASSAVRPAPREEWNDAYGEVRTPFDWLSRDTAEVDRYIDDPYCGFDTENAKGWRRPDRAVLWDPQRFLDTRSDLPLLLIAGDADPINVNLEGMYRLERIWHDAGMTRIDTRYYHGARHELLNETNRDEVTRDIIGWIDGVLSDASSVMVR
jgi:alpha-beta hydrolase superfamily lysophospholipase